MANDTQVLATPKTTAAIIQGLLEEIEAYEKKKGDQTVAGPKEYASQRLRAVLLLY